MILSVKFRIKITIVMALLAYNSWGQSVDTKILFSGKCSNLSIPETIEYLGKITGLRFAYTSLSIDNNVKIDITFENLSLTELLKLFHKKTGLRACITGNQVLLRKEKYPEEMYHISGKVVEEDSLTPVPYATIYFSGLQTGMISDINGDFDCRLSDDYADDTLVFSFMGYESKRILLKDFLKLEDRVIVLKKRIFKIPEVHISSRDFKVISIGNMKNFPSGSLYMDTHGQQAALMIENDKDVCGKIVSVNYYLSSKGNTDAPFRVRLYLVDSVTGGPGNDMVPDILVVKPDIQRGWYSVDVRKYNLMIPEDGFFIAMEGIFPNDYDYYVGTADFVDLTAGDQSAEDDIPTTITYGQRLGYTRNRKNKNNTWHYSLSHTWFRLDKQPFGIMISADIQIRKHKDKKEKEKEK